MRCNYCKNDFSSHLIQPLVTNEGSFPMCPICALKFRNKKHGLPPDTPFQGKIAQSMYEEALKEIKDVSNKK